jgi:diguanylate cyclase (GGDEF)-like protein
MKTIDVLVVDDDDDLRSAVVHVIMGLGYSCRAAPDGAEALTQHDHDPADIVLTDWKMPRMNGLELCQALKTRDPPPYVILTTAFNRRIRLLEAIRGGADEFLRKPIDLDELEVRLMAGVRLVRARAALAERNEQLRHDSARSFLAARTDPLTSLANRLLLEEDLVRILANSARYAHRCSVAICDVDYFKQYNDRYGHVAGDVALRQVAATLRDAVRATDTVYRYGGEEFLILFPEQSEDQAALAMDRIRESVQSLGISNSPASAIDVLTISAGVAEVTQSTKDEWIARADSALYLAKSSGRNCVRIAGRLA